jgi:NodT family efflux transporter outer membrane factor (OMF) lipoprotein
MAQLAPSLASSIDGGKTMPTDDSQPRTGPRGREHLPGCVRFQRLAAALTLTVLVTGCTKLGPDYVRPVPTVQEAWSLAAENEELKPDAPVNDGRWWTVFNDPVLDKLVELAYQQNLTVKTAGLRILEARAQLGIAVGSLYPQLQQATADVTYINSSENIANTAAGDLNFWNYDVGLSAGWELDFWGRYARGIESADASLLASVAQYDDVLVSLTAQIANTYTTLRTFEERIDIGNQNIEIQQRGLQISTVRFRNGATTELDVTQAQSLLSSTQASVVALESGRRQALNALATLLGVTPVQVYEAYGPRAGEGGIPSAPAEVAVGIPADLLRRRPDVRLAELQAWAQSAVIGVAQADLYPSISLVGTIGLSAGDGTATSRNGDVSFGDVFDTDALRFSGGPSVTWNIFNYGRIKNNVRVQDARLQQLLVNYQNTVLSAGQEVEDAMDGFLSAQETVGYLETGATAAKRAVDLALIQYGDGATDYTTVLDTQRQLVSSQDNLTQSRGSIAQNLVQMYRALGGGWSIREGQDFVSEETRAVMRERTDWGGLLDPAAVQNIPAPDEAGETMRSPDW